VSRTRPVYKERRYGVVHGLANCRDCGWETQSYKNAQALAARHALTYGHHVEGEIGISYVYVGEQIRAREAK